MDAVHITLSQTPTNLHQAPQALKKSKGKKIGKWPKMLSLSLGWLMDWYFFTRPFLFNSYSLSTLSPFCDIFFP